jgi:hypothetical protein
MKTKNILDEMLGASPKAKNGEVVLFKPKLPEDVAMRRKEREELRKQLRETDPNDPKRTELIEKMKKINAQRSAKDDDALYKRYRERQAEYQKYEGEFIRNKSLPEGAGNGLDIKPLKGGVEVDENGVLRNRADGKSFTGDHDIFAIKDKRGKTLDIDRPDQKSTIDKVRKELHEEVDTQHGAQLNMPEEINRHDGKKYREMSKKEKALYEGIAEKHGIDPVNKKPIPRNGDMTPKEKPSDRLKRAKLDREKNDPTDTEPKPQDSATVKNPPTPKKPPVNRRKSNSKPEKVDVYDGSI